MAEKPNLREYYGRVGFSVRAYFVGTMGRFDGKPTSLEPLALKDEAERFVEKGGGADAVAQQPTRPGQTAICNGRCNSSTA